MALLLNLVKSNITIAFQAAIQQQIWSILQAICRSPFMYINAIGDFRLTALLRHYKEEGRQGAFGALDHDDSSRES